MNEYKRWIAVVLSTVGILYSIVLATNYTVNPYGVFSHKTRLNAENPDSPDRVEKFFRSVEAGPSHMMIGASLIKYVDPGFLENYLHEPVYNMGLAGATPEVIYLYVARRASSSSPILSLYVSVDYFSYVKKITPADMVGVPSESVISPIVEGLIGGKAFFDSIKTAYGNLKEKKEVSKDDWMKGYKASYWKGTHTFPPNDEKASLDRTKEEIRQEVGASFRNREINQTPEEVRATIEQHLATLRKLQKLCKEKNIPLVLFASPVTPLYLDYLVSETGFENFSYWEKSVADIQPFYDFLGRNTINDDVAWFHNHDHMNTVMGKLIFGRIFADKSLPVALPDEFGFMVTPENVEQHLQKLKERFVPYGPSDVPPYTYESRRFWQKPKN